MRKMTIFEFLKILETANGDEVLELIHWFQCGRIEFTDIDYIAKMKELREVGNE